MGPVGSPAPTGPGFCWGAPSERGGNTPCPTRTRGYRCPWHPGFQKACSYMNISGQRSSWQSPCHHSRDPSFELVSKVVTPAATLRPYPAKCSALEPPCLGLRGPFILVSSPEWGPGQPLTGAKLGRKRQGLPTGAWSQNRGRRARGSRGAQTTEAPAPRVREDPRGNAPCVA